jgi:GNAT superfamily N-acetyltransferase
VEEVELRDGSRLAVRPVEAGDKPLFREGFERFGSSSRYLRFMGHKKTLADAELAFLTEIDHHDHEAIGALALDGTCGIGVARYLRLGPTVAEAAVAVVDDWQGRGVGGVLLERLAARAREEGIERFRATLFAENRSMLRLFERVGEARMVTKGGTTWEIDVALHVAP